MPTKYQRKITKKQKDVVNTKISHWFNGKIGEAPKRDIPVKIREGLIVYVSDESKIEAVKLKYKDK